MRSDRGVICARSVCTVSGVTGSTVVLYSWVPEGATDDRQPRIQESLETLGVGVPIPS